ncbi:pyrroline-5-carboxylate reductase [Akkermansiaceae bacterium]|nr:pyrroline-5-carboxylate reductase [Akkermansiaceae bacterium]MDA7887958.1 pyrroline-5-carboxylate reductase [Akkermansiaceae bacterium]
MTIGLIGCGKMGSALTLGAIRAGVISEAQIRIYDPVAAAVESFQKEADLAASASLEELISSCDTFLLCVKPYDVSSVLEKIASGSQGPDKPLVLSIAAGITLSTMESAVAGKARIVRIMPNTPAMIGKGAAAYSLGSSATPDDGTFTDKLLSSVGTACEVKESLLDAVTGTSGSGPAYVYTFIEALADGALFEGIPRAQAFQLAAQTVLGAAAMVAETGLHPAELRDRVTSPGGTTIAGLKALEDGAFRATVMDAVHTATERAKELGQQ